ncbi:MAG: hypothetical protein DMF56_09730 [Acidobacteria bacterium]|nr:MAG: hypothetical protein DMF56_09730 [Acidobacteriota bacterium]
MMVGLDPRVCPPAEILGAYLEGKVDAPTRAAVQRHASACPHCVFVIGEVSRYLANNDDAGGEEETEEPARRRLWGAAVAAAIGFVCLLVGSWFIAKSRDPLHDLRVAAAAAPSRSMQGRLDGFAYSPYRAPRSDAASDDTALRLRAEHLTGLEGENASAWHARGIAALVLRKNIAAVVTLQKAVALAPQQAGYWSDLSAAHLAAAEKGDRAQVRAAVQAAERAVALDPLLPAAQFNRAVALQSLGRNTEAAQAYERYLMLDPASPWSAEARMRRYLLPR